MDDRGQLDALWRRYLDEPTIELRNRIAEGYLPMLWHLARRKASRLPASVDVHDLVADGMIGLLDAIPRFDPDAGTSPETFLAWRAAGAMVDGLRRRDHMSRRHRDLIEQVRQLRERLGYEPSDEEIRQAVDCESKFPIRMLRGLAVRSIDHPYDEDGQRKPMRIGDVLEARHQVPQIELDDAVADLLRGCSQAERTLVFCYYLEGLTFRETGQVLGLSDSRVVQMHTELIARLRRKSGARGEARGARKAG